MGFIVCTVYFCVPQLLEVIELNLFVCLVDKLTGNELSFDCKKIS